MRSNAGMANRKGDVDLRLAQVAAPQLELWLGLALLGLETVTSYRSCVRAHSHCRASRAEPNRFGLENKPALWNGSIHTACRTEPSLLTGWCLFLLTSRRPILLHNRSNFPWVKCVFFFTMSANTLDCEVLINAVHLRQAFWEQIDKNYQSRDLKLKLWEGMAAE